MDQTIRFRLNSRPVTVTTDGDRALLWVLRADLGLVGTKFGCGQSQCGACTVLVNREAVRSCRFPIRDAVGKEIVTIEGLERTGRYRLLQQEFVRHGAVQCGFCSPGMIMNACSLLMKKPAPTRAEIIEEMEGNLCRCGCYSRIVDAIQAASGATREGRA